MFNSKLKNKLLGFLAGLVLSFSAQAQIFGGSNPILCANGDVVTSPCFAWSLNPRTGFYQPALNQIGVAINGVNVGTWSATGYSSPFSSTATSYFATGGSAPNATIGGLQIWGGSNQGNVDFVDTTRTANNKVFEWQWAGGSLVGRFVNDAASSATNAFVISGGQATGITGITSNSGSGSWAHTGTFSSSGTITGKSSGISLQGTDDTAYHLISGSSNASSAGIYLNGSTRAGTTFSVNNAGALQLTGTSLTFTDTAFAGTNRLVINGSSLNFFGVGPHAIGGATSANVQLVIEGTFVPTGGTGFNYGTLNQTVITAEANASVFGQLVGVTLNKAGSGTHANFSGLQIEPPVIGAGAATLTNATTFKVTGPPTVGTNLRAVWVAAGITETINHRLTGFTFANIATNLTANGDIGYCSDCTIANPCAGGGTGALGKRLNGVNVCN